MQHIYDTLIIGGGPAGYSAALYASRAGLDTVLVEQMSAGGQMTLTDTIDNYPGFDEGIDGFTLGIRMQTGAEKFGAKTVYGAVDAVDFADEIKKVTVDGTEMSARTVIIATGAKHRELGIEEESSLVGRGLHYCAHCDGRFYRGKTVIVVGGGNSAVSDALYLSNLARQVILIHRRDTLRATKIYHEPLMNAENVRFVWDTAVTDFIVGQKLDGVRVKNLKSGEISEIICNGLFVSIGRKPAVEFLGGAVRLDENGYIVAGEDTKTSAPGVFAAGDVRTKILRQVVTAAADGAVAAHYAEEYINSNI